MLLQGKVYSEIRRETGASSATVSRVNRMLNYGTGSVAESVREDLPHRASPPTQRNKEGPTMSVSIQDFGKSTSARPLSWRR